ncbi:hypothetical protein B0H19DRAFT_1275550 [Mycena capillaripes]|nr:hypothetical protein B0H19DRAFT_1275550 [Mycena capillaripes]
MSEKQGVDGAGPGQSRLISSLCLSLSCVAKHPTIAMLTRCAASSYARFHALVVASSPLSCASAHNAHTTLTSPSFSRGSFSAAMIVLSVDTRAASALLPLSLSSSPMPTFKVVVIGASSHLHTSLLPRFSSSYRATIGAEFSAKTLPRRAPSARSASEATITPARFASSGRTDSLPSASVSSSPSPLSASASPASGTMSATSPSAPRLKFTSFPPPPPLQPISISAVFESDYHLPRSRRPLIQRALPAPIFTALSRGAGAGSSAFAPPPAVPATAVEKRNAGSWIYCLPNLASTSTSTPILNTSTSTSLPNASTATSAPNGSAPPTPAH